MRTTPSEGWVATAHTPTGGEQWECYLVLVPPIPCWGKLYNLVADTVIKDDSDTCGPQVAYALLKAVEKT